MPDLIRKTLETKLTAEPGERAVVARISTADVDRDGDVVLPSGLDATDFNKNPVVLLGHGYGDAQPSSWRGLPIGRAEAVEKSSKHVKAKVVFAERPASHPPGLEWVPDTIFSLIKQGVLSAFSIGFLPTESRMATEKDIGRFGDGVRRIISGWKLMEFSVVTVPANQNALVTSVSKSSWLREAWNLRDPEVIDVESVDIRAGWHDVEVRAA